MKNIRKGGINPKITKESCIKDLLNLDVQLTRLAKEEIDVNTFFDSYFPHVIDETLIVLEHGEITEMETIPVSDMVNKIEEKYTEEK